MRRITIAAAGLFAAVLLVPAAPAAIKIVKVYYDSPGSDYGSNASLNNEWIRLKNTGSHSRQLRDWKIKDTAGHTYWFNSLRLRPGRTVTVHTGSGSDSRRHVYWDSGWYIWNNDGDKARLKKPSGKTVDSCSWSGSDSIAYC
jgi:hypothetical protein